jgi:hypothetical protein
VIARRRRTAGWWRFLCSPLLLAMAASFVIAMVLLHDVAAALRAAELLRADVALARARVLADAALLRAPGEAMPAGVTRQRVAAGWAVVVDAESSAPVRFFADELPGAGPAAFGQVCSLRDPAPALSVAPAAALLAAPNLDPVALRQAVRPELCPALQRDASIALMHRAVGTDGDDFVLAPGKAVADLTVAGHLVSVPGHLWIEPGLRPLEVEVPRDLTVVVHGNIYLGRSLRTRGAGRLVLVAAVTGDAVAYADRDGNGQWSAGDGLLTGDRFQGPVEGAGSIYVGLRALPLGIDCSAALVAAGQLHLATDARIAGPVIGSGLSALGPGRPRLHAAGDWLFQPDRERIPGFATAGAPRPSLPRAMQNRARLGDQTLYLSTVAR